MPVQVARANQKSLCYRLAPGDFVRLSDGGSVRGVNHGQSCTVSEWDTSPATRSLCQSMY
ncbi:hypothetical protein [Pyxidicoccus caerfyrddinensis]|uniref:hypothetical protein n=1 Tax=Pyxidicoccus caerfyrddinensis TaxID=2709663 RepID=UPI0013DD5C73|nr:hypothetical protein [Pyxidicoccus caerfyrddinensis]